MTLLTGLRTTLLLLQLLYLLLNLDFHGLPMDVGRHQSAAALPKFDSKLIKAMLLHCSVK